ncbi:winged helix-turn-helix transcriptional regulator [Bradyrhizobium sp. U87765 SZCCT0131]|uniref:MarR family winged helix-turn-helix transcriptional regulator n=1 Tax=unclassified Bradyrhizobium TaxID=2631580 RepID=UPI001BAD5BBF|nr:MULTISPECIES: MarR family winged helix-turn-helix transcriptional regulator [unclassified Bradyrhizobium]MBR1218573.1 winged helix-turn-helix transcriptional regulator [Bradyrhizobium sp. U87765 SZCCT0131]MBR1265668.1 winged helix-turn-helix transcriptional regulator [Bradyrhizobium sp. U87765 SZCCT0134]MBR1304071.1 winged helix-turn-helix transcriptional regulator [Bradyrhizobium sp. U87765 SZCCT0110]MBR1319677.1 winged helix-turn-helix transcriptional regulator [Bradyrhizobium sp. U87765 S
MSGNRSSSAAESFVWKVLEIHSHFEAIHRTWADLLGISEPQWLILMAIDALDQGSGVSGVDVSSRLRVHPAFVTTQTKSLEKTGLLTRIPSPTDARFVLMSLTPKARAEITRLSDKRAALDATLFGALGTDALADLNAKLETIRKAAERAVRQLELDL